MAKVGVHGKAVRLNIETLWSHIITLTTRLVDTVTIPILIEMVASGRVKPRELITHYFALSDTMAAYDAFGRLLCRTATDARLPHHLMPVLLILFLWPGRPGRPAWSGSSAVRTRASPG